jgi:hypothetical protein
MLGRADWARERELQMIAAANANNPYDTTISRYCAAYLRVASENTSKPRHWRRRRSNYRRRIVFRNT